MALYGTGLGPVEFPDNDTPVVGDLATAIEIFVGGVAVVDKRYSGRDGSPGVDQMVFAVPNDAPPLFVAVAADEAGELGNLPGVKSEVLDQRE